MTRLALLGFDAPALLEARRTLAAVGAVESSLDEADAVLIDLDAPAGQLAWLRWPDGARPVVFGVTSAARASTPRTLPPGPPADALVEALARLPGPPSVNPSLPATALDPTALPATTRPRSADAALRLTLLRWPGLAGGRLDAFRVATTLARGADTAEGLARRSGVAQATVDALLAEGVADGWVGQAPPADGARPG